MNDAAKDCGDSLSVDPLWSFRSFGDHGFQIHSAILANLAKSLETLAKSVPTELNRLLGPYTERPHDAIAYLVLRAWTAAPEIYAERLANYLAADPRRLKVGYASWGSHGGSATIYVSSQAVRAASVRCSPQGFAALEHAIISLKDDWEAKHPQIRGLIQLELLQSLDESRLGASGQAKLDELRRKFPSEGHAPPRAMKASFVGSPIPEDAQEKMTDEQWLRAMQKYGGVNRRLDQYYRASGGERELAQSLATRAKIDPTRFATLAERMPDDLPASYFGAILQGVADRATGVEAEIPPPITLAQTVSLVRRCHELPGRPCGRWIAWVIEKWVGVKWPEEVIDAVAWYALNDPDPETETWTTPAGGGQYYHGGDPYSAGINSTRGATACAIAGLLFDQPEQFERLQAAVHNRANDRSIAVRSCAIDALLAVLNVDLQRAISWFLDCVSIDSVILGTPRVERFVSFAGYRDFGALRPVIVAMLESTSLGAIETGARQICLLALYVEAAKADVERVQNGTLAMRKAAAEVYSANITNEVVGPSCRQMLKPFFADSDDSVRAEAASAFREVASLAPADQADLLAAFLDAAPGRAGLEPVVRALEDSPVQLPDLVCQLAEACIEAYRAEAGDLSKASSMVSRDLSKIVVRLYAQTEDSAIQSRCLDMIDEMERHHFIGLSDELRRLDR